MNHYDALYFYFLYRCQHTKTLKAQFLLDLYDLCRGEQSRLFPHLTPVVTAMLSSCNYVLTTCRWDSVSHR